MSPLDVRTILIGHLATAVVCAFVSALLWMQYRRRFAGIGWWTADFGLQALGALLILLRGSVPDWMSIVLANVLLVGGALAGLLGLERFVGRRGPQIQNYLLLAAFAAVHSYFAFVRPDLGARNLNLSILLLILCAQCAWLLRHRTPLSLRRAALGAGMVFAGYCVVSLARVVVIVVGPISVGDFFESGGFDKLVLLAYQALLILLTFGLVLMVASRLQTEVHAQEEKFTKAFQSSPYAVILTRVSDGRILEVNQGFAELTGYSYAESVGRTTLDLQIWPDGQDRVAVLGELAEHRRIRGRETQFRKKSGESLMGLFSADIITVGDEPCVLSSVDDTTDRKRVEAALRDSERKFRETVLYLDEGYYSVTLEGKLLDHNRAFARIIGFPQDEDLRGTDVPDFWSHPAQRREYVALLTAGGAISSHQVEAKRQSGEKITVLLSAHVVLDDSGGPHHIEGVVLDITPRIRAEEELRQLNQELEQRVAERAAELSDLYNYAPCGYHSLDEEGMFVRINDTELNWLGYTREELLGKLRFSDIITPASLETFARNFAVFKERGWISDLEFDLVRKDGTTMPVLLSATAARDQDGHFVMSRSTMIDYADRKEAEDALHRSQTRLEAVNQELEAFAYSVSHDLRAPLRAIDGFSHMILEDYGDTFDAEGRRLFDAVRANAQRMDQLITDLLALSRVARAETVASRLDMDALVRKVFAEIAPAEVESVVSFSVSSLPEVYGDETLIRQVWSNLLSNALKYSRTKTERHIEVGGYVDGSVTVYYVKDNGVGFDPRYAHKLFGLFQRLHKATDFEGSGVGLAIVQRIVHLHGGKVWAEGSPDEGATFYFALPTNNAGQQTGG